MAQAILLVLVAISFAFTAITHIATWYYLARHDRACPPADYAPPVSIIKPTRGVDQSALENFRSFCEQEYAHEYELLFCVEDRADPSVAVIRRVIEEYPDRSIRLIFSDPDDTRAFGKLKNMIAGLAASAHDVILFSDSDARVPPTFLRETVACLQDPTIGIAFGAPAYSGSQDWAAALTSVSVNDFLLRIAAMSLVGRFEGAIGTAMVVRKAVIARIGGLEQFGWQIADDIQLARAIRRNGYRIHLFKQPASVFHSRDSFRGWWSHMHRWLVIIRHYWPVHSFLMSFPDLVLWWGFLYLIVALSGDGNVAFAGALVLGVLVVSLLSAAIVNVKFVGNEKLWRYLWVVPIRELLRLPLLLQSYLTNEIVWRGRRFRIERDCTTRMVEPLAVAHDRS